MRWETEWAERIVGIFRFRGWFGPARSSAPSSERRRATGVPVGNAGGRGHCRRVCRGVLGRRSQTRGPDADVRLHDVCRADHRHIFQRSTCCGPRRGWSADTLALAAGTSTAGSLDAGCRSSPAALPFETLIAEASGHPARQRRPAGAAVFRRGAHTHLRPGCARGLRGTRLRHGRGHLFRAAYEGISFGVRQILEKFDKATRRPAPWRSVVDQRRLWTQILTDVCVALSSCRRRRSAPATATRCWRRSASASSIPAPTGRRSSERWSSSMTGGPSTRPVQTYVRCTRTRRVTSVAWPSSKSPECHRRAHPSDAQSISPRCRGGDPTRAPAGRPQRQRRSVGAIHHQLTMRVTIWMAGVAARTSAPTMRMRRRVRRGEGLARTYRPRGRVLRGAEVEPRARRTSACAAPADHSLRRRRSRVRLRLAFTHRRHRC